MPGWTVKVMSMQTTFSCQLLSPKSVLFIYERWEHLKQRFPSTPQGSITTLGRAWGHSHASPRGSPELRQQRSQFGGDARSSRDYPTPWRKEDPCRFWGRGLCSIVHSEPIRICPFPCSQSRVTQHTPPFRHQVPITSPRVPRGSGEAS